MSNKHSQNLAEAFLGELSVFLTLDDLVTTDHKLLELMDCYNTYAVKDGTVRPIESSATIGEFKALLGQVPTDKLKVMLFNYASTEEQLQKVRSVNHKEKLKHNLAVYGFLLLAIVVIVATFVTAYHSISQDGQTEGVFNSVFNVVLEVFRIVTNLD